MFRMVREGRRRGYSLLELLVVMAILGLLLGLGGSWGNLMNRERRYQAALDLRRSLNFARAQAVVLESRVTLCALDENRDCRGDWSGRDYAVFLDENRNRHADESEILRMGHWSEKRGTLTWRAAFGRGYITFEPGGNTAQNGSFRFCPETGDIATRIVVNRAGRNYVDENNTEGCG